ncbi:ParB/RepB/Spo0J family partition protein [Qipengyuania sp.]|uniref:ParB/RepB/Spo0J family partition protein n=1 Tax=Qipengyuania sp. TaxID=2004515 RepID=UPI0035C83C96
MSGDSDPKATERRKLGRGLGALMGEMRRDEPIIRLSGRPPADDHASASTEAGPKGLVSLDISSIRANPDQPRTQFEEGPLAELAESIKARGLIQPIIVRPAGQAQYQIVAGERRWRAAQKAQLHQIPAIVRELDDREVMALALIENIQREDLNPVEEARAYRRLSEEEGMTQTEIAKMVDKSRSHVANFQRLLELPEEVLGLLADGRLAMGHARALIGHPQAVAIAERAAKDNLSVREVERLTRKPGLTSSKVEGQSGPATEPGPANADLAAVQSHLEEFLGMSVRITVEKAPNQGVVTIRYRTLDQLDLICQRLTGGDI